MNASSSTLVKIMPPVSTMMALINVVVSRAGQAKIVKPVEFFLSILNMYI